MNGTVSQIVALVSAANGVLLGKFDPDSFYPAHAEFKYCNTVHFVELKKGLFGKARAVQRNKDPNEWLGQLPAIHAVQAWLTFTPQNESHIPDHQLAGFVGGGGRWQLVVSMEDAIEFWTSRWEVTNPDAPDDRIWKVTYSCVNKVVGRLEIPQPDLDSATTRLHDALKAAQEFAAKHDLPTWADWFQNANSCLDPSRPVDFPDYINFVCLDAYPEISQRLFAAAYNGWVFGGMGSWNDLSFQPKSEDVLYQRLSSDLYAAITNAIQQATWSFNFDNAA